MSIKFNGEAMTPNDALGITTVDLEYLAPYYGYELPNMRDFPAPFESDDFFKDFIGQDKIKNNLEIAIKAAKITGKPLGNVALIGPYGCGKHTLAKLVVSALNANARTVKCSNIVNSGDIVAILTNLSEGDVLLLEDYQNTRRKCRGLFKEMFLPAIEEHAIDIILGKGPIGNSIHLDLPQFTLISISPTYNALQELKRSFDYVCSFEPYTRENISDIIIKKAGEYGNRMNAETAEIITECTALTPKEAVRTLKKFEDYALVNGARLDKLIAIEAKQHLF